MARALLQALGLEEFLHGPEPPVRDLGAQFRIELGVAPQQARFHDAGHDGEIPFGLGAAFPDRPDAVPDLQAEIPEEGQEGCERRLAGFLRLAASQDQQVDIGGRQQLRAAITAHGDEAEGLIVDVPLPGQDQQLIDEPALPFDQLLDVGALLKRQPEGRIPLLERGLEQWQGLVGLPEPRGELPGIKTVRARGPCRRPAPVCGGRGPGVAVRGRPGNLHRAAGSAGPAAIRAGY